MLTRRSLLKAAPIAPLAAAAAAVQTPRPKARRSRPNEGPAPFRVSTVEFQRAMGRKPRKYEVRSWRFVLLAPDEELDPDALSDMQLRGPFIYALGLVKWQAWQHGSASIEILD